MNIKTLEVAGIGPAIRAMRNPFDSWSKSDTVHGQIGPTDKDLSERLCKSGPSHGKHLRMCVVWAEIWAPRYWWQEFDTNRMGVEKVSCSTIHTLTKRHLTTADIEWDGSRADLEDTLLLLNELIDDYNKSAKYGSRMEQEQAYRTLKQALPEGFIQRRTVMMSYQALRNMYELREGHRLREWEQFRIWCETLPESWMITGRKEEKRDGEDQAD